MARSWGPGKACGKSMTSRSGPVTACTSGVTRWLISISISVAPADLRTATCRTWAGPEELTGTRVIVIVGPGVGVGTGSGAVVITAARTGLEGTEERTGTGTAAAEG